MITIYRHVFYTECLLLLRHSREWLYPLCFFLIIVCLFPIAFTPDPLFLKKWLPGCLWMAALFASILSMQSIFASDIEDGHLEQCLFTRTPFHLLILAKLSAHWVISSLPLVILTPLIASLFGLSLKIALTLFISMLLATPILTLIGSLGVALTFGLRQKGVLLGLLILPMITPVLIFAVALSNQVSAGMAMNGPLAFLAGLFLLSGLLLPLAIGVSIRIGVDD